MPEEDLTKRLEERFAAWPEQDALFHCEVEPEEKFGAILKGQYEEAVISLDVPSPPVPEFARRRLEAGHPWIRKPPSFFRPESRFTEARWAQLVRRHALKREKALLHLANERFRADLLSLARNWGLDTNYYLVIRDSFYGCPVDGRRHWQTLLLWVTGEYLLEHEAEHVARERASALQYADDLDFDALQKRHLLSMLALPVHRFGAELCCFTRKHGLGPQWERSIKALLLCGWLFVPLEDCRAVYRWEDLRSRLLLEVFAETREEDLVAKWQEIKKIRPELFPDQPRRQRRRPSLGRDLSTRVRRGAGQSLDEIVVQSYDCTTWEEERRLVEALKRGAARVPAAQARALSAATEPRVPRHVVYQMIGDERRRKEWHF
jgi:hypothetical protein